VSSAVFEVLQVGREGVARAVVTGATTGPEPDEETITWVLHSSMQAVSDRVKVRQFTRSEESQLTAADWLWWWQGEPSEWFGCLVQAKRLKRRAGRVGFDFEYRPSPSSVQPNPPTQLQRLLDAADALDVPAAYLLFRSPTLGLPGPWQCTHLAPDWHTGAATFLPAAVVHEWAVYGREFEDHSPGHLSAWLATAIAGRTLRSWLGMRTTSQSERFVVS
jgi:hypothetical protein